MEGFKKETNYSHYIVEDKFITSDVYTEKWGDKYHGKESMI